MPYRMESDFLGERKIPNNVYYGVQTLRGIENFKITGLPISLEPFYIQAFGYVKKAAAMANAILACSSRNSRRPLCTPAIASLMASFSSSSPRT
jgi:aspartate ammonia-lyase